MKSSQAISMAGCSCSARRLQVSLLSTWRASCHKPRPSSDLFLFSVLTR